VATDVNARDALGRTVLDAACSALDPAALEFVRLLLAHPAVKPNAQDVESHWTPLHRALYSGNIAAAYVVHTTRRLRRLRILTCSSLLLLQRADIDMFVKDYDGYTPFDVYNSTVDGTKPLPDRDPRDPPADPSIAPVPADLFTWRTNRSASLGLGDPNDRAYPDQLLLRPGPDASTQRPGPRPDDLRPVHVLAIAMSKLHTTVLTAEPRSNVRACGFASGGWLAPAAAAAGQPSALPPHQVVAVALGQDHTLALTATGEVFSWGLNRFGQLGYVVEGRAGAGAGAGAGVGAGARRVLGPLRGALVLGVAASKSASACWTATHLYTWGTNGGQFCASFVSWLACGAS
jgi:hypothetical protein